MKLIIREGNLEIRSVNSKNLMDIPPHDTLEIIQWYKSDKKDFCITIAIFRKGEEYNLEFVGSRPFEKGVSKGIFWDLAEMGNKYLNKIK